MNKQKDFAKVKVQLAGSKVERWLVLPESLTLEDFHDAIQAAFGWEHSHLWSFKATGGAVYEIPSDDYSGLMPLFRDGPRDASKYTLSDLLPKCGAKAKYIYDFGDNWVHVITRMAAPKERESMCVKSVGPDGEEDFGGCWRWSAYLYLIKNGKEKTLAQDPDFPEEITAMYLDDQWTPESAEAFLRGPTAEEVTRRMREQIGNSVDLTRIRL